jgi:hypothetical protein
VAPFLAVLLGLTPALRAAPAATNPPAVLEIPRSTFVVPASSKEGRDPFFPDSTRSFVGADAKTNAVKVDVAAELMLKGFSALGSHRLAIINNHPFESGEENDVTTANGRVRIRCVEIKQASVVIEIAGERRELFFRDRK